MYNKMLREQEEKGKGGRKRWERREVQSLAGIRVGAPAGHEGWGRRTGNCIYGVSVPAASWELSLHLSVPTSCPPPSSSSVISAQEK